MTDAEYDTAFQHEQAKDWLKYLLPLLPEGEMSEGLPIEFARNIVGENWATDFVLDPIRPFMTSGGNIDDDHGWYDLSTLVDVNDVLGNTLWKDYSLNDFFKLDGNKLIIQYSAMEHFSSEFQAISGEISESEVHLNYSFWLGYESKQRFMNQYRDDGGPLLYRTAVFKKDLSGKYKLIAIRTREPKQDEVPISYHDAYLVACNYWNIEPLGEEYVMKEYMVEECLEKDLMKDDYYLLELQKYRGPGSPMYIPVSRAYVNLFTGELTEINN